MMIPAAPKAERDVTVLPFIVGIAFSTSNPALPGGVFRAHNY
jgi:hypothetical protein